MIIHTFLKYFYKRLFSLHSSVSKIRAWTDEEESLLREKYLSVPVKTLAEALGRSVPSIDNKIRRLGLIKSNDSSISLPTRSSLQNSFEMMTREDAQKLDKIDLLRVNWSLFQMYERELDNPKLSKTQRHKLMGAMCSLTSVINSIMKGSEEQLGDEDDLKARFTRLNLGTGGRGYSSRRSRRMGSRYVRVTF